MFVITLMSTRKIILFCCLHIRVGWQPFCLALLVQVSPDTRHTRQVADALQQFTEFFSQTIILHWASFLYDKFFFNFFGKKKKTFVTWGKVHCLIHQNLAYFNAFAKFFSTLIFRFLSVWLYIQCNLRHTCVMWSTIVCFWMLIRNVDKNAFS